MTLMPVSKISVFGSSCVNFGARRWIGQRSTSAAMSPALVHRLAEHVQDAAQRRLADGHRDGLPGVAHRHAAREAVRRRHGDRADLATADVLLHLGDELDVLAALAFL
jgi:hypothetical protein